MATSMGQPSKVLEKVEWKSLSERSVIASLHSADVYCMKFQLFRSVDLRFRKARMMDIEEIVAQLKQELARLNGAITALEGTAPRRGRPPKSGRSAQAGPRGRRRMSAAARAKIAAAQRARWAKQKRKVIAKNTGTAQKKASRRRVMSAAARKRLSELMKKRWAERKKP